MKFDSIETVKKYLSDIPTFQDQGESAANFNLSRFEEFCGWLGNPQHKFPSIHVAGTNGKGSTCHILASIYQNAGFKTGLYTSPHILDFKERFQINDKTIPDKALLSFFQKYHTEIEHAGLSYFEISTAIAFWWFSQSAIDIAVIEVGLGGRLDATNIIDPLISVITSISIDHTNILGNSIEEITQEKAGIIKPAKPVVIGDLPVAARSQIIHTAEQRRSPIHTIDMLKPVFLEPNTYQLCVYDENLIIESSLSTPVQAKNIAIAWQVSRCLRSQFPVSREQFVNALSNVDVGFGRFNKLTPNREWYFDGAHNVEAVQALKESVRMIGSVNEAVLVLSMMKDKIRPDVITEFSEFENIYYYELKLDRAATFDDISKVIQQANPFPSNHQRLFLDNLGSELVIFAGSFYFYGTVREWITN